MFKRRATDPAEYLFHKLGFDDLLESIVRTTARAGASTPPAQEELDPASIKARANLANAHPLAPPDAPHLATELRAAADRIENAIKG